MPAAAPILLPYRRPFDWDGLLDFIGARAIAGVEAVVDGSYRRSACLRQGRRRPEGWYEVRPAARQAALELRIAPELLPATEEIKARVRAQFDLDHDPRALGGALDGVPGYRPGIRLPGSFDGFEATVRAILGQQITVAAAGTLAGRLARELGEAVATPWPELDRSFPEPQVLAASDADTLGRLGVVRTRSGAIRALAQACARGQIRLAPGAGVEATLAALLAIRGIGEWTAHYAAMRALGWADAFPAADYGVKLALGVAKPAEALRLAEAWRPWRAYAVMCLWHSLGA